jgi:ubiquinone/menaquinone biosynthesis C-methylase UbiE
MKTNNSKGDWAEFYEITKNKPPSKLLVKALEYVKDKKKAIDIGGGALKDTRYLLSLGFDVTVIDKDELMAKEAIKISSDKLQYVVSSFEDFNFPKNQFDIASATFALPFNSPDIFKAVLDKIKNSLVSGGVLCGQLFGTKDQWVSRSEMTFHTKEQVEELFKDMEIIYLDEEERDGTIANGTPKHWHIFHVIARKK